MGACAAHGAGGDVLGPGTALDQPPQMCTEPVKSLLVGKLLNDIS